MNKFRAYISERTYSERTYIYIYIYIYTSKRITASTTSKCETFCNRSYNFDYLECLSRVMKSMFLQGYWLKHLVIICRHSGSFIILPKGLLTLWLSNFDSFWTGLNRTTLVAFSICWHDGLWGGTVLLPWNMSNATVKSQVLTPKDYIK